MNGKVKAYSTDVNAGVIKGNDGKDYQFQNETWGGASQPKQNESVTFESTCGFRAKKVMSD